jgi:hypothetical protein
MTTIEQESVRPSISVPEPARALGGRFAGWRLWAMCTVLMVVVLAATVPTTGDIGLTWDEPAYRYSQIRAQQWWERLASARSVAELRALIEPNALLFYWPYARHGINFHPPLAGQLSLLTHAALGRLMKDLPARRMASVLGFALTIALGFGFLARRYGPWVGLVMASSLLLMPRVYGDGHIAGTDTPGLFLWPATALAFWKGLYEPRARRSRVVVGVLVGLAFVEKMGAVLVLAPLLVWLVVARLPASFSSSGGKADWVDGLATSAAMLAPLGLAFAEILRLSRLLPPPSVTNLFVEHPTSSLPGAILAVPLGVWVVRRLLSRCYPASPVWGTERPALEIWTAVLAFAPVIGWLGNPAWWRETMPRLAHYYMLNTDRRGSLPDIRIFYFGQIYQYSLPWHNAWVLIAITVPVAILAASACGLLFTVWNMGRDRLPLFFLIHLVTLPVMRMFPTPAHDGVRLFLPTFFFLAAMAGWGAIWVADGLARLVQARSACGARAVVAVLVLGPSAWQLVKIHPFELSYYNELIGGARGAWNSGFELTYWYDAFDPQTIDELNRVLPPGASVDFLNDLTNPMTFAELQSLGELRSDILLGARERDRFPYVWLLSQDSKASSFTRLLFAMRPWYSRRPRQLDGGRVLTVADPVTVSRAWALSLLAASEEIVTAPSDQSPGWLRRSLPFLGRFWGDGVSRPPRPAVNEDLFKWARDEPAVLLAAASALAERRGVDSDPARRRLKEMLWRYPRKRPGMFASALLRARPEAIVEAVKIVINHPDAVRTVLTREPYTDPELIGGTLDRDLPP